MRYLAIAALVLSCATAHAQADLGSQVLGQLPPANASNAATFNRETGMLRGMHSATAFDELFTPTARCSGGVFSGWDYANGASCFAGHYSPAVNGTSMYLNHTFWYGSMGAIPGVPLHMAMAFNVYNQTPNTWFAAFNNCGITTYGSACGSANEMSVWGTGNAFGIAIGGTSTQLWPSNSPVVGSTDSDNGSGWVAPVTSNFMDVRYWLPGDGTAMVSFVPWGEHLCTQGFCATSFRVPISQLTNVHQVSLRGSNVADDFIANFAVADGLSSGTGVAPIYDMPNNPVQHVPGIMRWALHTDGTEWDYRTSATDLMNVYAVIPTNYDDARENPWVLHIKGNESCIVSLEGDFEANTASPITDTLLANGIVQVSVCFHSNVNYGGPQAVKDMDAAIRKVRSSLHLAAQPFLEADSAGGITALNAITHGVVRPKAMTLYSPNLSLFWDAFNNTQVSHTQEFLIANMYGYTSCQPSGGETLQQAQVECPAYFTHTAGYDPLAIVSDPTHEQTTVGGTYGLIARAAGALAGIKTYIAADPSDQVVATGANSIPYCAAVNKINPGICTINTSLGGGHVGAAEMVGSTELEFFQANR